MSRVPNYILSQAYRIEFNGDLIELPQGMFVRPLHIDYVPKHILESKTNRFFNSTTEVFCYTRFGIVSIPLELIKEA